MFATAYLAFVNHLLAREPWARDRLSSFSGRSVRVLMPTGVLTLEVDAAGFLAARSDQGARVRDTASPPDPAGVTVPFGALIEYLVHPEGADPARISGEPRLAETIRYLAEHLRWDVEDDLARVVGDIAAHRIVRALRALRSLQRESAGRLLEGAAEYLSEEKNVLAARPALDNLAVGIAGVESSIAALESRITALEARHS